MVSQSKADVLAPMSRFKTIFPPIVLMTFWVVLLLSIYSIRKSLVPLELLKNGTRRIAMKNFDSRVDVKSGDEFEELAMDFNEMASHLNRQFKTLNTMAEIDRAILSSLDARIIVKTIIHRMYDWFVCESVAMPHRKTPADYISTPAVRKMNCSKNLLSSDHPILMRYMLIRNI